MSAAVVPGAKLLAATTKGPAVPLILRPAPGKGRDCAAIRLVCAESFTAEAILFVRAVCEAAELGREGGLNGLLLMFVLDEER